MINDFTFPFGQPVRRVEQQDRAPKRVFVLGVYASAVHARWIDVDGTCPGYLRHPTQSCTG